MNRLFALLVVLCLIVGPPRAASLVRAGDGASPTEQKEDGKEDAKEAGKEGECSLGADFALARRPFTHPELRATGAIPGHWPAGRALALTNAVDPHPRPPLSRLPKRQI